MEEWLPLAGYPGYLASDQGRIRKERTGLILSVSQTANGNPYVGLTKDRIQIRRGLALLIANTFLPRPQEHFDTPIHVDGDLMNCRAANLAWRPRWFAQRYTRQFKLDLYNPNSVRNIDTGDTYDDIWTVVTQYGVLYNDVVSSIINMTYVFPLMHRFEWIDPN